jgi:hypothetical protein
MLAFQEIRRKNQAPSKYSSIEEWLDKLYMTM